MAENQPAQERTEDATPKRRQDARKKGSVAKSQELTSSIVLGVVLIALPAILAKLSAELISGFRAGSASIPTDVSFGSLGAYITQTAVGPALAALPLLLLIMGAGVFANVAQVGFLLSAESLKPNFKKLNPIEGAKRMFSRVAAMEGAKAIAKTVVFGYLAYAAVEARWNDISALAWQTPQATLFLIGDLMKTIALRVGVGWLLLAGLDYFFQRRQLDRNLRMTKDEVRQEFKEMEQSPELKAAMARRRRKLGKSRPLQAIKEASVIVTNPTHFAVALKYEPGQMHAPQVVAKGVDFMAARIREEAETHRIPIVPNPPLARTLYRTCEVGDFVPRDMFQAVAEVLAFVYRTVKKAA